MGGGSCEVVLFIILRIHSVQVGAAFIPVISHFQVGYGEGLRTKTRGQVFKSGNVLIHDLLGAYVLPVHSVLLEGLHKFPKHSVDPDFRQEVVFRNAPGERLRNAMQEATKVSPQRTVRIRKNNYLVIYI